AVREAAFVGFIAADLGGKFSTLQIATAFGDDINRAEKGVGAIEGGARTSNDFYSIDQINIERRFRADGSLIINVIIQPVTINQQQDARVVVPWPIETAHTNIIIVAVRGDIDAVDALKDVRQGAISIFLDFISSDDGNGRRSLSDLLSIL